MLKMKARNACRKARAQMNKQIQAGISSLESHHDENGVKERARRDRIRKTMATRYGKRTTITDST